MSFMAYLGKSYSMKSGLHIALICIALSLSAQAQAFDAALAQSYQQQFNNAKGAAVGKAIGLMGPDAFIKLTQSNKPMLAIDIRTPEERGIFGLTINHQSAINLNELFTPDNLAKIPTDKPVVLVCKSGLRAMAAATALRHLGYDNVKVLKGGFASLTKQVSPQLAQ